MNETPLTETALLERIALGEHTRQQFKRHFNNPDALAAELAAFANSGGGTLLIGVSFVLINNLTDLLVRLTDPRVR